VKRGAACWCFNPLRERGLERFADPQDALEMLHRWLDEDQRRTTSSCASAATWPRSRASSSTCWTRRAGACRRQAAVLDHAFIAEHTEGFDALLASVRAAHWRQIEAESGLSEAPDARAGERSTCAPNA
jgi:anaerobic selenocysteine-containing dehydrogenase